MQIFNLNKKSHSFQKIYIKMSETVILNIIMHVLTLIYAISAIEEQVAGQAMAWTNCEEQMEIISFCSSSTLFLKINLPLCTFIPPDKVPTISGLLWIVVFNDFILMFIALLAKIGITLMPARMIPYQKWGKYYLFLEVTSQLHRQLAPLQPWLMYLLNSKGDGASSIPNKVLGVFLTAAYMVVKGKIFVKSIKSFKDACVKLMQSTRL